MADRQTAVPPSMKRVVVCLGVVGVLLLQLTGVGLAGANAASVPAAVPAAVRAAALPAALPCGLPNAAFCDTFDAPAGTGNRSGDLNGTLWGVSRDTSNHNVGQGVAVGWVAPTTIDLCGTQIAAVPPNDVRICNGQLREASSDGSNVTSLAMYPKQPFDFAGRTGKIVFDVSNDSEGTHGSWPELWITDKPVPAPFRYAGGPVNIPQNGLGIRFNREANCNSNLTQVGVDSAIVIRNYVMDESDRGGLAGFSTDGCVTKGVTNGLLNHFEVWVSQSQIDVYGTDPGSTTLVHLARVVNANLTFTKGLIWIEDVHYNATKSREPCQCGTQKTHTYTWDNVGFDGPFTYRDVTFDVLDHMTPGPNAPDGYPTVNLGWISDGSTPLGLTTLPMDSATIAAATGALLTLNIDAGTPPPTLTYTVNGHAHTVAWPVPALVRSVFVPVPLSDLVAGPNAVTLFTGSYIIVANVDIVLVAAVHGAATPTATPSAGSVQLPPPPGASPAQSLPPPGAYHSGWVDQSDYPVLAPGATGEVTLHFRNTGSAPWVKGVLGTQANLGVARDDTSFAPLGVNWLSANRPAMQSEDLVPPGAVATFSFQLRAPLTPGVYQIYLRPVIDGLTWMEDEGVYVLIIVTA
jgi:hypothetical protein